MVRCNEDARGDYTSRGIEDEEGAGMCDDEGITEIDDEALRVHGGISLSLMRRMGSGKSRWRMRNDKDTEIGDNGSVSGDSESR